MADVSGVKSALVQTQAMERVQETARRQGETQQQSFAADLNKHVADREQRVNEGEKSEDEMLDSSAAEEQAEQQKQQKASRRAKAEDEATGPESDEEDRGRLVDARV